MPDTEQPLPDRRNSEGWRSDTSSIATGTEAPERIVYSQDECAPKTQKLITQAD